MDKIKILSERLSSEIIKNIAESENENLIGKPLQESMFYYQLIIRDCQVFREFLEKSQSDLKISEQEIEEIIKIGSDNVENLIFENNDKNDWHARACKLYKNSINFDKDKFIISSLYYQFCFSAEVASLFLNESENSENLLHSMINTANQTSSTALNLFKSFLKQKNIELISIGNNTYSYNNFIFKFIGSRHQIQNTSNYFEILSNDINNVTNEDNLELAIASNFVVYVENHKPKVLCCVVSDPYVNKYAIRKVSNNGTSTNIGFIENNNTKTICEKILENIPKKVSENNDNNLKLNEQFKNYKAGLMSLIEDKKPAKGADDNKMISYYLGLLNKNKAFDFYELVRVKNNGAIFRINTMNGFTTIAETNSEIIYKDMTSVEWFNLIYNTSMQHFFKEEYKLFKSGYVKEKSGGCLGVLLAISFIIVLLI